ncbi:hypothetical protein [Vibrio sinaloensis]|uniref:hypothetical protein n=1 Tax=Photobacterium sp. (strain ATCC 43367) TaxID=379097 RepID=UPI0022AEE946|nr:hypothetical protein [Vibrio sinaloensis]MCZ4295789.1 hypothetical protein [Vibrio sinaloensis]
MYKTQSNVVDPCKRRIRLLCKEFESVDIDGLEDWEFHEFRGKAESCFDIAKDCGYKEEISRLKMLLGK